MDGGWFDELARMVGRSANRRSALKALAAVAGATFGWVGVDGRGEAVTCRSLGRLCRENANCCGAATCERRSGRNVCACVAPATLCNGVCIDCTHFDTPCSQGVCDPETGGCRVLSINEGGACDLDGDLCTLDVCEAGQCVAGKVKDCPECQVCVDGDCVVDEEQTTCVGAGQFGGVCCDGVCRDLPDEQDRVCCAETTCPGFPGCCGDACCECGSDSCGGACGTCPEPLVCSPQGRCVDCVADCENKQCGDDGCGGSCGDCGDGRVCNEQTGTCEAEG